MVAEKYRNAFQEVYTILGYLRKEDYDKISKETIDALNENRNSDYSFKLEENIELKDQNLMPETRAILLNLFYDFYADEKQKELINDIINTQNRKTELEKQGKYDVDVFRSNNSQVNEALNANNDVTESINEEEKKLVIKKESIFVKIINKIKKFFIKQ